MGDGERGQRFTIGQDGHLFYGDNMAGYVWQDRRAALAALLSRPEPQPTMTGGEIAAALRTGKTVEGWLEGGWSRCTHADWWDSVYWSVVARVVEPESEPRGSTYDEIKGTIDDPEAPWNRPDLTDDWPDPPAPVTDLPEGVHEAPSGELLCLGMDIPSGWERRFNAKRGGWSDEPCDNGMWYEVRPASPVTEQVRWQEAMVRQLPIADWNGAPIVGALLLDDERWQLSSDVHDASVFPDASGCVTVLAEDGQ